MVRSRNIFRLVRYLPVRRFQYRYNTYNPAPKSIKNIPKATKPAPKPKRAEIMVNAKPLTRHTPGKLRVNARKLNLIIHTLLFLLGSITLYGNNYNQTEPFLSALDNIVWFVLS